MCCPAEIQRCSRGLAAWAKFAVGALLLSGVILTLMQGYAPPGPAGEVFRSNLRHGIDATPLFYTESDVSAEAEAAIRNAIRYSPYPPVGGRGRAQPAPRK